MADAALKKFEKTIKDNIKNNLSVVNDYLMDVINGNMSERVVIHKSGDVVDVPVSNAVRIQASKVWKELNIDKVLGDAKEIKRDLTPDSQKIAGAVKDIAKKKRAEAEKKLKEEGKLTTLAGNN